VIRLIAIFLPFLLRLSGCAVGPNYKAGRADSAAGGGAASAWLHGIIRGVYTLGRCSWPHSAARKKEHNQGLAIILLTHPPPLARQRTSTERAYAAFRQTLTKTNSAGMMKYG